VKPISLTLQNFGPYSGAPVVIDFEHLDPLFLITGDTGAGKTTLFDGICYALYGEPLGTREDQSLRSDYAQEGESTLAEFIFEIRGCRYLARRSPVWYEPRKRGTGWLCEEIHTLQALTGPEPAVLASRTTAMTEKVQAILGLTHGEFAKILVLPQGEFQRFLEMSTGDRDTILRKLFPIQEHVRLTERAKAKADEARRALGELQAKLKEAAGDSPIDQLTAPEREQELQNALEAAVLAEGAALAARDAAIEDLRKGGQDAAAFQERDRLLAEEQVFAAGLPGLKALGQELRVARKALACQSRVAGAEAARDAHEGTLGRQTRTRAALAEARATRAGLQATLDTLPERREQLARLQRQDTLSAAEIVHLAELEIACADAAAALQASTTAAGRLRTEAGKAREAKAEVEALRAVEQERDRAQAEWDRLAPRQTAMDRLQADAKLVRAWPDQERLLDTDLRTKAALAGKVEQALAAEESRVEALRLQREQHLASVLAAALQDGEPCPVCGSGQHPHPAPVDPDADPGTWSKEPPRINDRVRTAAESAREAHNRACQSLDSAREAFTVSLGLLQAGGWSGIAAFDAERAELATQADAIKTAIQDGTARLGQRAALVTAVEAAETAARLAQEACNQAEMDTASAGSTCDTLIKSIGRPVPDPGLELQQARHRQTERRSAIAAEETAIQNLQEQADTADQAIRGALHTLNELEDLAASTATALTQAEAAMAQDLEQNGFASQAEQTAALRSNTRMDEIDKHLKEARDAQIQRNTRLEDLQRELQGKQAPDLAALAEAQRTAKTTYEAAAAATQARAAALKAFRDRRGRVQELLAEIEAGTSASAVLQRMAEELDGRNSQKLKFPVWALSWWLDRVLEHSTHRLQRLSEGRYRFRLRSGTTGNNKLGGLEIDVHDSYSNGIRSVRSLSGGEKFLASLALALGLAEVIQSRGGGIELDALFIDEGFGSLDGETLEQAMRVLDELGQGRRVGLISHVEGMKRSIPCQIRVLKQESGSRVEVVGCSNPAAAD
jgi:exonuclease SbcC